MPVLEKKSAVGFSKLIQRAQLCIGVVRSLLPGQPPHTGVDEEDPGGENDSGPVTPNMGLRKLHEDLDYLGKTLGDLTQELATSYTFTRLEQCVSVEQEEQRRKAEFIALFQGHKWKARHREKSQRLQGLQQDLRLVREDTQALMQDKDDEIAELLEAIKEAQQLNPQKEQYEQRLAEVQVENLHFHMEQEEKYVCQDIARVGREMPQELRVHDSLTTFLKESCAQLEAQITDWEHKFTQDTQDKAEEVGKWEEEVQGRRKELEEMTERCEEYWSVVLRYREEQAEAEWQRAEEERRHKAAAKIQAWWRGYTVRRGMSALRKKLKKAKGAKK